MPKQKEKKKIKKKNQHQHPFVGIYQFQSYNNDDMFGKLCIT